MNLEYIKEYPLTLMGFDSISEGMVLHLVKSLGFSEYDYDYDNIELYVSRLIRDKKICKMLGKRKEKIKWQNEPEDHNYPAAKSYLNLLYEEDIVEHIVKDLIN